MKRLKFVDTIGNESESWDDGNAEQWGFGVEEPQIT